MIQKLGIALLLARSAAAAAPVADPAQKTFLTLLKEYKRFPVEMAERFPESKQITSEVGAKDLARLPEKVLKARYQHYNPSYQSYLKAEKLLGKQLKTLKERFDKTPMTDAARHSDLELKVASLKSKYDQVRFNLYVWSVSANLSLKQAVSNLPPEKQVVVAPPPKLPGVYGGSWDERSKVSAKEKVNLTPVDAEFYETQLGKKLEKDLGTRAKFWSYDFKADELYVKSEVDSPLTKVRVRPDPGGVRFIQTRVGSDFTEPVGSDQKVDLYTAKGKFLTGDEKDPNLFGAFPKAPETPLAPEVPAAHGEGDGHKH